MSKAKITEDEFTRFERLFFKIWHVYEFGNDKYYSLSDSEVEHLNNTLEQFKQEYPREYDIIIRHYLKRVYYTTIAREQGVSEGYIRKLCKNGAYYFLQIYDKKWVRTCTKPNEYGTFKVYKKQCKALYLLT